MDRNIQIIKETVHSVFPECRIILFGSRAREEQSGESDYDILVLIPDSLEPLDKLPYRAEIRKKLLEKCIFSDVLLQSYTEAEVKKKLPGHIVRTALQEGKYI
ncbi:MAG: nucleotidyltransferase domain-containing protein [Bacteroidales bacterium]|nr:nucleotidyltransferase domain-containing protein [Bacteroidales bacterium]